MIQCTQSIGREVDARRVDTSPDAGTSSQIDKRVEAMFGKDLFQPCSVLNVGVVKLEAACGGQLLKPVTLEAHVVVVVEVVHPDHPIPRANSNSATWAPINLAQPARRIVIEFFSAPA